MTSDLTAARPGVSRRTFLQGVCCGTLAAATKRLWTPAAAFADDPSTGTVVVVFLRGALDGLNTVIPHTDPAYRQLRPTIGLDSADVIDLDGTFGLHPALAPLHDLYRDRHLALVHAAGSLDPTRSHFDAQALMERGTDHDSTTTGWLARHVAATDAVALPLHAIAWGAVTPASLRGDLAALSMRNLAGFDLSTYTDQRDPTRQALAALYGDDDGTLGPPSRAALAALDLVGQVRTTAPAPTVTYPSSGLGRSLSEVARTIKADVGLSAATIDTGGWDLHVDAGSTTGPQQQRLADLAGSLAAFHADLADRMADVTVIVMSEFGRRAFENGSGGTDHGSGNVMFVLGAGVAGGQVHGDWSGLAAQELYRGDVPVLTDYRDIVGEVVTDRHASDADQVFPAHTLVEHGIASGPTGPPASPDGQDPGVEDDPAGPTLSEPAPPLVRHGRTRAA